MEEKVDILVRLRAAADKKVLFLPHALRQMLQPDRMITSIEVRRVIAQSEVIEDYPENARGQSCLLLGYGDGNRPIHAVCAPKEDCLAIITTYLSDKNAWSSDFSVRVEE